MATIDILVSSRDARQWHVVLADRLGDAGHDVRLVDTESAAAPATLEPILYLERKLLRQIGDPLYGYAAALEFGQARENPDLAIDVTGADTADRTPLMRPLYAGKFSPVDAASMLIAGGLPDIEIQLDGDIVARGAPMVDSRISIARGLDDVLARTITLLTDCAGRFLKPGSDWPRSFATPTAVVKKKPSGVLSSYVLSAVPRQAKGILRRIRFHGWHWKIGYRFHGGPGVAETGLLSGPRWNILADDGQRFYADPFPFEQNGRHFIFAEEFPQATKKGVISVAEILRDGSATVPRAVLEEPFHLSYPQVFARDGHIWMLPEGGNGGNLVLYRAESFPDNWVRHMVLVADRQLFDSTLLEHDGRLWLFATERDGYGSAADTMVVFSAPKLDGPWTPHPQNPVMVDRAAARPGGGFVCVGDRIILPVQDGTAHYGGGLGLCDLLELDEHSVKLTRPVPVLPSVDWPYPKIHTLNRAGDLEVIDGIVSHRESASRRAA